VPLRCLRGWSLFKNARPALFEVGPHPLGTLREDLEGVPRRERHHREHAIDERVGHVLVEQVADRVDEVGRRHPAAQRRVQTVLEHLQDLERLRVLGRDVLAGEERFVPHVVDPLRVAVTAAWRNLIAPDGGIPSDLRPLD
jgi:hypothetical protein